MVNIIKVTAITTPNSEGHIVRILIFTRRVILAASIFAIHFSALAQGGLTPPGAPTPTMKSLAQIEPRTPISTLPFNITQPGSYYVTTNLTATGDGIIIDTNDVALDLGGFTLSGDGGASDDGVNITSQSRVSIRNGTVRNFGAGVHIDPGSAEVTVEDMTVIGNVTGLSASSSASTLSLVRSVFRRVRAISNTSTGIFIANGTPTSTITQNIVDDCEAIKNTDFGIQVFPPGNLITRCRVSGSGTANYSIGMSNRLGTIVFPAVNPSTINGSTGGPGTGTTDPFANLSF